MLQLCHWCGNEYECSFSTIQKIPNFWDYQNRFDLSRFCCKECYDKFLTYKNQNHIDRKNYYCSPEPGVLDRLKKFYLQSDKVENFTPRVCLKCGKTYLQSGLKIKNDDERYPHNSELYCSYKCANGFVRSCKCTEESNIKRVLSQKETYKENPGLLQSRNQKLKQVWKSKSKTELDEFSNEMRKVSYNRESNKSEDQRDKSIKKAQETWKRKSQDELDSIKRKISETVLNTWNTKSLEDIESIRSKISQSVKTTWINHKSEILEKSNKTRKENNTFNSSSDEQLFYKLLLNYFKEDDIVCQYNTLIVENSNRYPFNCDFYIRSLDLFIELNRSWTHGIKPFNRKDPECRSLAMKIYKQAKLTKSDYYKIAFSVIVKSDPLKFKTARENNLNYVMIYNDEDWNYFFKLLESKETNFRDKMYLLSSNKRELFISKSSKSLVSEFTKFKTLYRDYSSGVLGCNTIVQHFQWKELYKDSIKIYNSLTDEELNNFYKNREFYIGKSSKELTNEEIIRGLSIAGVKNCKLPSMHTPFYLKNIIKEFHPNRIYDPCGGWGHRLLGCWDENADRVPYIYNDINLATVKNIKEMTEYFNLQESVKIYNEDAGSFTPTEDYDMVYTCPPYWNTEIYSKLGAENLETLEEFLTWWRSVVQHSIKPSVKWFIYQINNKYKECMNKIILDLGYKIIKEIPVGSSSSVSHFQSGKEIHKGEQLVIFDTINN